MPTFVARAVLALVVVIAVAVPPSFSADGRWVVLTVERDGQADPGAVGTDPMEITDAAHYSNFLTGPRRAIGSCSPAIATATAR